MALSQAQKKILVDCKVPEAYQTLIASWLNDSPNKKTNQDFLLILADLLQTAEKHLEIKRKQLSSRLNTTQGMISPGDTPPQITASEENIKLSWSKAIALWQAVDAVIRTPDLYGIELSRKHARYALLTRNLPVIEMIAWAKPEFFTKKKPSLIARQLAWFFGGILSALLGLVGGFFGGIREGLQQKGFKKILFPIQAIAGLVIGWSSGAVIGARVGYRTGSLPLACKLGYLSSYKNPFHDPKGFKNSQAVDLLIEEILFDRSDSRNDALNGVNNNRISF